MKSFPTEETSFLLQGPAGAIEILAAPVEHNSRKIVGIICHPHPLYGGTMHNKVVTTLAKVFSALHIPTLRFNFRGVGKSEGSFAEGIGETDDLLTIIRWVKEIYPEYALWLAGFSFGGFVASRAAVQVDVSQLITVAPQVSRFIETHLPPITCPWILVQGEKDEVVLGSDVFAWIDTLKIKPQLIRIPDAGHFFHGKLLELRDRLVGELGKSEFDHPL